MVFFFNSVNCEDDEAWTSTKVTTREPATSEPARYDDQNHDLGDHDDYDDDHDDHDDDDDDDHDDNDEVDDRTYNILGRNLYG